MHSVDTPVFTCQVCGKAFSKLRNFRAHERRHVVPNARACETCGQVFLDAVSLQHHQKTHSSKQVSECGVCHRLFSRKTTLDSHMRLHTNDRKFQCPMCGKSNGSKQDLLSHVRTHTGERPFKCMICQPPTTFTTRSSLMRHTRTHSGYQPHCCKCCNKTFSRKDQYTRHMSKHLQYNCLSCNSTFETHTKYSKHLITCADSQGQNASPQHVDSGTSVNSEVDQAEESVSNGNNALLSMQLKECEGVAIGNHQNPSIQESTAAKQNDYKRLPSDGMSDKGIRNQGYESTHDSKIVYIMVEQDPIGDDNVNEDDFSDLLHLNSNNSLAKF